jgi:ANTAR domain-containing protein
MTSRHGRTTEPAGTHRRSRKGAAGDSAARPGGGEAAEPVSSHWPDANAGRHAAGAYADPGPRADQSGPAGQSGPEGSGGVTAEGLPGWPLGAEPVARRTANGWKVGDEEVSDLTSAMVLADLLVADLPTQTMPIVGSPAPSAAAAQGRTQAPGGTQAQGARPGPGDEQHDPKRLRETVAQLEHALTARVRVEQAIGVLAERHRLRPRQAFELLRSVARARGKRVLEIATEVVESATNPLLRIPEELAKPPVTRRRGRVPRHTLENG